MICQAKVYIYIYTYKHVYIYNYIYMKVVRSTILKYCTLYIINYHNILFASVGYLQV